MNKYKLLTIIDNSGLLEQLLNAGIVSVTIIGHKNIYERYIKLRVSHKSATAVTIVSEEYKCSESTVWKIINDMKSMV